MQMAANITHEDGHKHLCRVQVKLYGSVKRMLAAINNNTDSRNLLNNMPISDRIHRDTRKR
jgi:hypothetical protein